MNKQGKVCSCTQLLFLKNNVETQREDTIAYKIYWTELTESDIIRENCGNKK
jgi:hypothetical protein